MATDCSSTSPVRNKFFYNTSPYMADYTCVCVWGGGMLCLLLFFYHISIILFVFDQSGSVRNWSTQQSHQCWRANHAGPECNFTQQAVQLLVSFFEWAANCCSLPLSLTLTHLRSPLHPCWLHNFHTDMWEATQVQQSHLQQAKSSLCLLKCRISWKKKNHIQPLWRLDCLKVILSNVCGFDLF